MAGQMKDIQLNFKLNGSITTYLIGLEKCNKGYKEKAFTEGFSQGVQLACS